MKNPATLHHPSSTRDDRCAVKLAKRSLRELSKSLGGLLSDLANVQLDPVETTHQLRVISRRADIALRLFKFQWPRRRHWLRRTLQEIRTDAGAVRDLDLLELRWRPGHGHMAAQVPAAAAWMHTRIQSERRKARQRLLAWTRPSAARRLRNRAQGLLQSQRSGGRAALSISRGLLRLIRQLKASLPSVSVNPQSSHQTRIYARRLRYALELLRPMLTENAATICTLLASFQEQLGQINDDATEIRHLQRSIDACRDPLVSTLLQSQLGQSETAALGRLSQWVKHVSIESLTAAMDRIPVELRRKPKSNAAVADRSAIRTP